MSDGDVPFSHLDAQGRAKMVDVSDKQITARWARARGELHLTAQTRDRFLAGELGKGDGPAVTRVAAIQAAKETGRLIPLCHPLGLDVVDVEILSTEAGIALVATTRCHGRTGVEMEALAAVSVGLLAAYDMIKAVERSAQITGILLLGKGGGRSGEWLRDDPSEPPSPEGEGR